jgi:hypothetical protein
VKRIYGDDGPDFAAAGWRPGFWRRRWLGIGRAPLKWNGSPPLGVRSDIGEGDAMTGKQESIQETDARLRQMALQIWTELRRPGGRARPDRAQVTAKGAAGVASPAAKKLRSPPASDARPADARPASGRAAPPKAPARQKHRRAAAGASPRRQAV